MKKIKILLAITILCIGVFTYNTYATSYTWMGGTSTAFNVSSNWSPATGFPGTNDTAIIFNRTNNPVLDANRSIYRLAINSGTFDLNGFTLTMTNTSAFTAGIITNGTIKPEGIKVTFTNTHFNATVTAICSQIFINGGIFDQPVILQDTGIVQASGNGGAIFNSTVKFIKTGTGTGYWGLADDAGNTYNDDATFINTSDSDMYVNREDTSFFNGNVIVGCNNTGGVSIGGPSTPGFVSVLASGKSIQVDGTYGYTNGTLTLRRIIQLGSTAQTFSLTSSTLLNIVSCTFNAAVSITSPKITIRENSFNGAASFTQTSTTTGTNSYGGNTFNSSTTLTGPSTGSVYFKMGANADDLFNGDVTVGGKADIVSDNIATVKGNLYVGTGVNFNHNSTFTGTLKFAGSNAQVIHGNSVSVGLKKVKIDKTANNVTLDTTVTISDTLFLVSKNIITTSTHLLSFNSGSVVTGATNSSFVSGPVKKTGNTAFIYPCGKNSSYRALEMSAPSTSSNAYTAEYFDGGQALGNTMDGTIKYIRDCGYWNLARNSGTSNVTVKLSWDSTTCGLLDSATVKVANWNGSTWKDLGNGGVTGNRYTGKVANSTTVITWGYFAIAYNKCFITANAGSDQSFCTGDSVTIGSSPVSTMGMTPYTYSWSPSGGLSSTSAANPKANPSSTTNYVVSITDLSGCTVRDTATIYYHPQTYTWTGATSSDWETASNWTPVGGPPLPCDNVVIVSGSNNVQFNNDHEVTNFTINSGTINVQLWWLMINGKAFFNGGTINNGQMVVNNTDTASFSGTHFEIAVEVTANKVYLNGSQFDSTAVFYQTGSSNTTSSGGNIFNQECTIENLGNGNMYLANTAADSIKGDVTFYMSGGGTIFPAYTKNSTFGGNILLSYHPEPANGTVVFGNNGGKAIFNGNTTQTISYSYSGFGISTNSSNSDTLAIFKKMQISKPAEDIILGMSIRVTDSLILTKGNIVSDTTNLLCMRAGSVVIGTSDTSFVDGTVKKFGNSAFVFPTGKGNYYRAIEMSAPSVTTDAFIAEYFDTTQTFGMLMDSTIGTISPCNYWKLTRNNGSSNVYVTLSQDTSNCWSFDSTHIRIAYWDGSKWQDKGQGTFLGNRFVGKVTSSAAQSSFGYFSLAGQFGGAGFNGGIFLCENTQLQTLGSNQWGSLGINNNSILYSFTPVTPITSVSIPNPLTNVIQVAAGGGHFLALLSDGTVRAWGYNVYGELGNGLSGAPNSAWAPVQVLGGQTNTPFLQNVVAVSAGYGTSMALLCNGQVVCWGKNYYGESGNGVTGGLNVTPVFVRNTSNSGNLNNVAKIAMGTQHAMALLDNGRVVSWGWNGSGALGNGSNSDSNIPVFVQNVGGGSFLDDIIAISSAGEMNGPTVALDEFSLALKEDGTVCSWGSNDLGQLGDNNSPNNSNVPDMVVGVSGSGTLNNVRAIDAFGIHALAIVGTNRTVHSWGDNSFGALGTGSLGPPSDIPINIGLNNTIYISAGYLFSYAINSGGTVYSWGLNSSGQLGFNPNSLFFTATPQTPPNFCNQKLPCDGGMNYCFNNITLPTGLTTWDDISNPSLTAGCPSFTVEGTIRVPDGATLSIQLITIYFGPNGRIVVEQGNGTNAGGTLEIRDAILTSVDGCMWEGIQAYGDHNYNQLSNRQSQVIVAASIIENAHVGIFMGKKFIPECVPNQGFYSGGILQLLGANTFTNNNISVEFPSGYPTTFTSASLIYGDNASHIPSLFECTAPMIDSRYNGQRSQYFIRVNHMKGITIGNNITFENTPAHTSNITTAVQFTNNCLNMKVYKNYFNDNNRAIECLGTGSALSNNIIDGNEITRSNQGIHVEHNNQTFIVDHNIITDGVDSKPIGVFVLNSRGTMVRDNEINGFTFGIDVLQSGTNSTLPTNIWKNDVTNSARALMAGGNDKWTNWWCNDLNTYSTNGMRIFDYNPGTGNVPGNVKKQGECPGNPAGNIFGVTSGAIYDIENVSSTLTFQYVISLGASITTYDPIQHTLNVNVTYCPTSSQSESSFCGGLRTFDREIVDILAERDTATDTLTIGLVNNEALLYYASNNLTDSAIWYLETYGFADANVLLIPLYIETGRYEDAQDSVDVLPSGTDDEQDQVDYYNLLITLAEDSIEFYDMDSTQLSLVTSLSTKNSQVGRNALAVMNLLYGTPVEITCEMVDSCDAPRLVSPLANLNRGKELGTLKNIPNPFTSMSVIIIPPEMQNSSSLKLSIYDNTGRIIKEDLVPYTASEVIIHANGLSSGTYFYSFTSMGKKSEMGKMTIIK